MVESLVALALTLLFLASSLALGRLLCRAIRGGPGAGQSLAAELSLGMGIYGFVVLVLGVVRMLYPAVAWGLLLAPMALWGIPSLRPRLQPPGLVSATADRCLVFLVLWAAGVVILKALEAPATYDGLAYHLANAGRYVRHHALTDSHFRVMSYWPNHFGALYAFGLLLGNGQVPSLINAATGLATAGVLVSWGARRFSLTAGLGAAAVFLSLSITRELAGGIWIDSGAALYVVLALDFADRAWESADRADQILAGLSTGFACASKLTGLLAVPVILAALVAIGRRRPRECAVTLGAAALAALVAGGGWYLRSGIETGNPTYPFFSSLFTPNPDWAGGAAAATDAFGRAGVTGRSALDLLILPWRLVADPLYVEKRVDYLMVPFYGVLLWYLIRARGSCAALVRLGLAMAALALLWFLGTGHNSRHGYAVVVLICLSMTGMIHQLGVTRGRREAWAATVLPGALFVAMAVWNARYVPGSFKVASGLETRESVLRRGLGGLHAANLFLRRETPPGTRVLLCAEMRGYYCDRDLVLDYHPLTGPDDLPRFHEELRRLGIDYVLHNPENPWGGPSNIRLWAARHGEVAFTEGNVFVYRVKP